MPEPILLARARSAGSAAPVRVVIVDRDPAQRRLIAAQLEASRDGRFAAQAVASAEEAPGFGAGERGILVADLDSVGGTDRLGRLATGATAVIATSARGSVSTAVAAMRAGAVDFLPKPFGPAALIERIEAAVANWTRDPVAVELPPTAVPREDFEGFIGRSPAMRRVYDQIERIAPSRAPVFVTGESGTGKEVCAEAIHARSGRADGPFVALNCSAIPKDLMESEIFGHVRGAFTGATETRAGAAERADGGTLFLDEIGEMDMALQAKLLRFVQTGMVRRVGDGEDRRIDVRFVCATHRDPLVEIAAGRFREDLFYRLHVLPIHLPALRERGDDVMALAEAFLARYAAEERKAFRGFDAGAAEALGRHIWPGNVRELQNVVRRIVVLEDGEMVTCGMLPAAVAAGARGAAAPVLAAALGQPIVVTPFWEQERTIIEAAVAAFGGNVARAAAALEISPSTIYRKRLAWQERRTG
ncbi:sigma-54-dependent transcriptional regulator [Prosthecomicrobium pneumaticum]|uniref:Two-component system repressor protein LuxO n=1 Tax=Prosthecomicrobium pneumaticum TaxID=81895 RepID=A0A7W9FJV6_9HYPH|nr:sigma-54 dependent transcriptional regulator [Prosthecomicrobium pneumaticum]MBB5752127.1 two-component system repressor protein LuxO [Prosthecomicrobium pneumaticum]